MSFSLKLTNAFILHNFSTKLTRHAHLLQYQTKRSLHASLIRCSLPIVTCDIEQCLLKENYDQQALFFRRGMAGHSHWKNVMHTKMARDAQKAATNDRCLRLIRSTLKEPGGNDPKLNVKLEKAIRAARQQEVPIAKIENALKSSSVSKDDLEAVTYDIKGPGNCFLIVETLTDHKKRTSHNLRALLKKIPLSSIVDGGGVRKNVFNHKGVICAEINEKVTLEKALDDAIEVGAEDVKPGEDDKGTKVLQFISGSSDFYEVCKKLEQLQYNIVSSELLYLPQIKQPLNDEAIKVVQLLYEKLEEMPEVVKIHDNIE